MTRTGTAEESEESGAEDGPGGAAAGWGATLDATSEDADAAGAKGRYGAKKREGEKLWASESSGMGSRESCPEASGVAESPRGDRQGVGGGIELSMGTHTHRVEELPRGEETSRATLEGNGCTWADGWGQGGDRNSPATQDTEGRSNISRGYEMLSRQEPAAP